MSSTFLKNFWRDFWSRQFWIFLLALFLKDVADDDAGNGEHKGDDGDNATNLEHGAVISDDEFHFFYLLFSCFVIVL